MLLLSAASIWFEIWGSWIWVQKNFDFPGKFPKNVNFLRQFHKTKFDFPGKFTKNFDFFRQFHKNIRFSRQKLAIYSFFWANYSISLQKSPLSNILRVHNKT